MKNLNKSTSQSLTEAQKFCWEVKQLARKYQLPFFIVTDGASATCNEDCDAVEHARKSHIKWEKQHKIDPEHDWEK